MDTKTITILNIIFIGLGLLFTAIDTLIKLPEIGYVGLILVGLFSLISFVQLLSKGKIFYNKQFFYPLLFFIFLSFAAPTLGMAHVKIFQSVGIFGVMLIYATWYFKKDSKNILDVLKLIFVEGVAFVLFADIYSIANITHLSNIIFIIYLSLVALFYKDGIKKKYLMK